MNKDTWCQNWTFGVIIHHYDILNLTTSNIKGAFN